MFKVNNRNTKTRCEICSKLAIKTPEQRHWHRSGVFVVNFWTYFTPCSNISNFDFEQVNASWVTWKISICDDWSDKISSKWFGWGDMYLLYVMETNFFWIKHYTFSDCNLIKSNGSDKLYFFPEWIKSGLDLF